MKIYTRTGDSGTTGLFGGDRVSKDHLRIEAYGTVDETNSFIGLARSHASNHPDHQYLDQLFHKIQSELFILGADLATPQNARVDVPRIEETHVSAIEQEIDRLQDALPELKHFILPGGTVMASTLHIARTLCRRAERRTVALHQEETVNHLAITYMNRLSDLLFVLARWVNIQMAISEERWKPS